MCFRLFCVCLYGKGYGVWIGVVRPCPPVCKDIVTPLYLLIRSWLKNAPHQGIGGVSICDFPHFGARNPTKVKNNFYSIMDLRLFGTQDLDSLPQNK